MDRRWSSGAAATQWRMHPVNARPVWVDRIAGGDLPRTHDRLEPRRGGRGGAFEGGRQVRIPLDFDYQLPGFPSELNLFLISPATEREPFVRLTWDTPGR
jgi:peptide/nickel transport system permease protein